MALNMDINSVHGMAGFKHGYKKRTRVGFKHGYKQRTRYGFKHGYTTCFDVRVI